MDIKDRYAFLFIACGLVAFLTIANGFDLLYFLVLGWIVVSHFVAKAAERKNRSYISFLFLSGLLSPLLTGVIVAVMANPDKK